MKFFLNPFFLSQVLYFSIVLASPEIVHNIDLTKRTAGISRNLKRHPITGTKIKPAVLRPVDDRHPILGRRDQEERLNPDNLALKEDMLLQWAAANEDSTLMHAKIDIISDDGTKLLFSSRFQDFTTAVDCSINDGDGLSITFKTPEYLDIAKNQWGWVTEDSGNTFWIITNHRDCSKDEDPLDEYVPYKVTDVDYPDNLTAEFVAVEKHTMAEALANFNFDFTWGQLAQEQPGPALSKRWNPFEEIEEHVVDPITEHVVDPFKEGLDKVSQKFGDAANSIKDKFNEAGDLDESQNWDFDIKLGEQGKKTRLAEKILGEGKELWCVDCYAKGKFKMGGRVRAEKFLDVKEASFSLSQQDVKLMLKLNAKLQPSEFRNDLIPIYTQALTPIQIPVLFHIGPALSLDAEFGRAINEPIEFEFGLEGSLPNDASVSNDLVDDKNIKFDAEKWSKASADVLPFDLRNGAVDIDVSLGLVLSLSFGYEIFGIGGHEAALKAYLPTWKGNFTSFLDEEGACEKKENASKIGVKMDQSIAASLKFFVGPTGMMQNNQKALADKELWKMEKKLDSKCKGIKSYADDPEYKKLVEESDALDEEEEELDEEIALLEYSKILATEMTFLPENSLNMSGNGTGPVLNGTTPSGVKLEVDPSVNEGS